MVSYMHENAESSGSYNGRQSVFTKTNANIRKFRMKWQAILPVHSVGTQVVSPSAISLS